MSTPLAPLEAVVLGVAAMDLTVRVDRLPRPDELVLASGFERLPGGAGANVAVGLARLGRHAGFWGPLGSGPDARALRAAFTAEGVDASACPTVPGKPQATCIVTVDERGERTIVALGGAGRVTRPEELDLDYLRQGRVLFVSDYAGEVAAAALSAAREAGTAAFYSPGGWIAAAGLEALAPLLPLAYVLILSRTEAGLLVPTAKPRAAAERLLEAGPRVVVITLGAEGALLAERPGGRSAIQHIPALPVEMVVDTTGAGDAFAAGLACGYLEGRSWPEAVRLGSAAAGLKLRRRGARAGLPTRTAVATALVREVGE